MLKKIYLRKIISFILFLLGINTLSFSQSKSFLPFTKLEIKTGLPGINVRKITKDRFGFMWFATQDGISRFDGRSYINLNSYSVDNKRRILGTDVFDIKPDLSGRFLWALSSYGGLNKIDLSTCTVNKTFEIKLARDKDTSLWYKCMAESENNLIIGTNEGIVYRFLKPDGITDYSFSLANKFGYKGQLDDIFIDSDKQIWFFISGNGILITDSSLNKKIAFINAGDLDKGSFYFTDLATSGNSLFITTTNGLKEIRIREAKIESAPKKFISHCANKELHGISIAGSIAIISGKNLLYKVDLATDNLQEIQLAGSYEDHSWITLTNAVFFDDQNIWLGSQYGVGWIRNIQSPFIPYYNSYDGSNTKISHSITIWAANDSTILVCGDDGLYSVNPYTSKIKTIATNDFFYSVFPVTKDYFIASGVTNGLRLFRNDLSPSNLLTVFPELKNIKDELMMCSARLGDSLVFIAGQNKNGLYVWNTRTAYIDTINTRSKGLSLRNNNINRLYLDSKNRLWIICENVVSIYDPFAKSISHLDLRYPSTKRPLDINMDICETKEGFWMTSYGTGVVEIRPDMTVGRIFDAKSGINNLGLYKIFPLNDSLLIATSNNGLSTINRISGYIKNYFVEDGVHSNSFEEASGDKTEKFIYVGGINGITRIDISKLSFNSHPPDLSFSTIEFYSREKISDTLNIGIQKIDIPSTVTQVKINFSAINFSAPEKIKFGYRIIENNSNWNFTNQSFIQSFQLPAGSYHLQVQAFNEDGVPSEIKELILVFLPKWYQAWWFKIIVALLIASIFYGLYKFRINHLKKEEKIRNQVASDLHDELGSTLNSVKVFTNLAMIEKNNTSHLEKIKEATQSAISGVKDIIWVLDDKRDTVDHLLTRINQFAKPLCEAAGISYNQQSGGNEDHKLGKEEKRNLYMIIKESINNSIKYSDCSLVELLINNKGGKLDITVSDNGKGFDREKITSGYGLKNILHRAEEIRYKATINSSPGNGTLIYLEKK